MVVVVAVVVVVVVVVVVIIPTSSANFGVGEEPLAVLLAQEDPP